MKICVLFSWPGSGTRTPHEQKNIQHPNTPRICRMHDDVLAKISTLHKYEARYYEIRTHRQQEMAKTIIVTGASKGMDEIPDSKPLYSHKW